MKKAVRERPIIFSAPMVNALLAGAKYEPPTCERGHRLCFHSLSVGIWPFRRLVGVTNDFAKAQQAADLERMAK